VGEEAELAPPGHGDILAAAERLKGKAVRTPLLHLPELDERLGAEVYFKPETLQRTGSFKFRGAYNAIASLTPEQRRNGILAWSSGNHAQGVAAAADMLGVRATIVMPVTAPKMKIERTKAYGAEVVFYDPATEVREEVAEAVLRERGGTRIPPFDHPPTIAGQGTAGLETGEDMKALGLDTLDMCLVPTSGGGLISGVALGLEACGFHPEMIAVEPEGWEDFGRSLIAHTLVPLENPPPTLCDALTVLQPGRITLALASLFGARGVAVTDAEAKDAMRCAFRALKLVVEPGGAVGLAAALANRLDLKGKRCLIVLSGGNVDPQLFADIIAEEGRS